MPPPRLRRAGRSRSAARPRRPRAPGRPAPPAVARSRRTAPDPARRAGRPRPRSPPHRPRATTSNGSSAPPLPNRSSILVRLVRRLPRQRELVAEPVHGRGGGGAWPPPPPATRARPPAGGRAPHRVRRSTGLSSSRPSVGAPRRYPATVPAAAYEPPHMDPGHALGERWAAGTSARSRRPTPSTGPASCPTYAATSGRTRPRTSSSGPSSTRGGARGGSAAASGSAAGCSPLPTAGPSTRCARAGTRSSTSTPCARWYGEDGRETVQRYADAAEVRAGLEQPRPRARGAAPRLLRGAEPA